ncbi:hypothetical protein D6C85_06896 [Aureobasidium pullulans]|uniref:Uncharacterized protein n=1 Tax=Aureobasidium pullulans TaxID=5580 RepID=A0A4S8YY11_AURPU|nr:hypothetical protein D6D20_08558 [Aureobasidium pullulans]THZ69212.1 hypothetical protein D6C85_06896 [Aureobasidium pullulans]
MTDQDNQQNNRRAPVRPPIDPLDHLPSDNPTMNNQAPVQGNINTAEAQHNNDGDVVQHVPPIARLDQDVVSGQNQAQSGSVNDDIQFNILWAAFEQDLAPLGNGHDSVDPPHDQSFWGNQEWNLQGFPDLGSEHMGNEMPPPSQPSMPTQFSYNPDPAQYNPTANQYNPTANQYNSAADQYNSAPDHYNSFQPYETSNNPFDSHPLNGFNQNNLPAQSNASGGMPASSHYSGFGTNSQSQHFPNLNEAGSAQRRFGFAEENPWAAEMNRMPQQFDAQNLATREAEQRNLPGQNAFYDHRPHQPQGYGLQQNNSTQSYGIPIHDTTHAAATVVTPVSRNTRKSLSSGNSNKKGPGPDNSSNSKSSGQRNSTSEVGGNVATPSKTGGTNSTPASNEHSSRKRARRTESGASQTESSTPIQQPNSAPNVGTAHNNGLPNYLSRRAISRAANPVGDRITPAKDLEAELAKKDDTKKRLAQDKVDRINERKDDVALARSLYKINCPEYAAKIARIAEEQIARIHARYEDTEEYVKEKTARSRS